MGNPAFSVGHGWSTQLFHKGLKGDGSISFAICGLAPFDGDAKVSSGLSYPPIGFSYPLIGFDCPLAGLR